MRIAVLSDIHVAPHGRASSTWHNRLHYETALERLASGLELATRHGAKALLLAGDLADDGGDESLDRLIGVLAHAAQPVWAVPGNHDAYVDPGALVRAVRRAGSRVRVIDPAWAMLEDSVAIAGPRLTVTDEKGVFAVEPPRTPPPVATLPLWLTHYPVLPHAERFREAGLAFAEDGHRRVTVEAALRGLRRPVVVVSGHLHARDAVADGEILEISASPSIEAPFEMTLLELATDGPLAVRVERIGLGWVDPDAGRLPVLVPATQAWVWEDGWRPAE